ncbi:MAG: hypothetical protein EAX95_04175 [Candidatus Thorarchaeota archaeon]|nr:hypothetical protein [Candidatus Thorarchaeota archaeon]
MARITTISNIMSGVGIAILAFAAIIKYILESLGQTGTTYPFYIWIVGAVLLAIVIIMSTINTFTEMTGFVHPEDKLVSNMFVFLMAIATVLIFGLLDEGVTYQRSLFDMAAMIVIAYIFLFIFVFFSGEITEAGEMGQVKEMTARFMLLSLLLGVIMAGVKVGLDFIWDATDSYTLAAGALGIFAVALVVLIVVLLGRKYEPVGE